MKTTIFKDALNRANVSIIQLHQILYLVQTVDDLVHRRAVGTGDATTVYHKDSTNTAVSVGTVTYQTASHTTGVYFTLEP